MARCPEVALMIETSTVYGRRLLQGIVRYLQSHRSWSFFLEQREVDGVIPSWLKSWHGDGLITRWSRSTFTAMLPTIPGAMVDVSDRGAYHGIPRINSDDAMIGRVGARHLLDLGLRSFAYCGFDNELWSRRRRDAFLADLSAAGFPCEVYESRWREAGVHVREDEQERIGQWIHTLPRPVGVMASNDVRSIEIISACRHQGLRVPEDVAVLGVDDDEILCEICHPTLSSIVPNIEMIGYEAAALLDHLMNGGKADFEEKFVSPLGVTSRQSTSVFSVEDQEFAAAVRLIRENACHGIVVDDLLHQVPMSRSTLERRFRSYLGHSPRAEIREVQISQAKRLLAETDHSIQRIAELVGFDHTEYFHVVFKREVGSTPGQYRRQAQTSVPSPSAR